MFNPEDPKSPYSPNDPRNPRNPMDQKNPGNPNDPKNPKSPFDPGKAADPQSSANSLNQQAGNNRVDLSTEPHQTGTSTLHPSRIDHKTIQSSDIVALLQNKGKVTLNGRTLTLKEPSASDPRFQEMINEPTLSVTPIGKPSESGAGEYEVTSTGRKLTIKIDSKKE